MKSGGTFQPEADASVDSSPQDAAPTPDASLVAPVDASATADAASPAPAPKSCEDLAAGGAPDLLVDFTWQEQTGACSGSACWTIMTLNNSCALSIQRDNAMKTFTLSAPDCAAARGWATNARFVAVLRDGEGCPEGMIPESFELTLTAPDAPRRKTFGCLEPTVVLERACWNGLADRLYPR